MTCRWFGQEMMDDTMWKFACLRDLNVHDPRVPMAFTWKQLYGSVFGGRLTLLLKEGEEFIDRKRIGGFLFESLVAFLMDKLNLPERISQEETTESWLSSGYCKINNIKIGIWIVDIKKVENILGDQKVIFEVRHIELYLSKAYLAGEWQFKVLGSHNIEEHADAAPCGIFYFKHIRDPPTSGKITEILLDYRNSVGSSGKDHRNSF